MKLKSSSLELDTTYLCNLACNNCTRRCDLLPGVANVASVETIKEKFREIIDCQHVFHAIFLMGGEPALYPRLRELLEVLYLYQLKTKKTRIIMVSNYTTNHIRGIVDALPPWVERRYAPKDGSTKHSTLPSKYWTMNVAPKDFPFFDGEDYSEACGQQKRCGIELATNGKYYACPMSGGIDRIFKLDVGVSSFSELIKPEIYKKQFKILCALCGRFRIKYAPYQLRKETPWETYFKNPDVYPAFIESFKEWPMYSGEQILSKSWMEAVTKL
jgi:Radical SAM superfamily.